MTKIIPGVYVEYSAEGVQSDVMNEGGVVGFVGDFVYGEVNEPIIIRSLDDFEQKLGGIGTDDAKRLYALLLQKPKKVVAVRIIGDGAAKASAVLQDLSDPSSPVDLIRITAKYYGDYGNDITYSVNSGNLTISYADKTETYTGDVDSIVSAINSISGLVVAEKLANGTLSDQTGALQGGSRGTIDDDDYIGGYDETTDERTGLAVLELVDDVEIVTIGGAPNSQKNSALIEHAKENDRIAVVPLINASNYNSVLAEVQNYYEDEGHVVIAFPSVSVANIGEINPAFVVAGVLGRLLPYHSMVNEPIYGVVGVSRGLTSNELESLISAKVNPITLKGNSYVVRHSLTTGDSNWKDISVRRVFSLIGKNTESILDGFIGEPNTPALWDRITIALENYLYPLKLAGWIADYQIKCNADNNPPELREQGIVKVDILVKPVYSANYFVVSITKVLRFTSEEQQK